MKIHRTLPVLVLSLLASCQAATDADLTPLNSYGDLVAQNHIGRGWEVLSEGMKTPRILAVEIAHVAAADAAGFHLDL